MAGPYSSAVLNDLHVHFPDLLYRSERFTTVSSVLEYLQHVARRSPYEEARAAYLRSPSSYEEARAAYLRAEYAQQEAQRAEYAQQEARRAQDSIRLVLHPRARTEAIFSEFLQTLLPQLRPSQPVIAAMADTLDDATLIMTAMQPSECAICQDAIEMGQSVRMIRHCTHHFHQECLDPWLQTHTTCPTCRYNLLDM
jgi:hypothetical protein